MAKRWFSGKTVQVGMSLFLLLGLLLAACRPAATPTPTPAPTPRVTPAPGATPTPAPTPTAAPTPKPKPLRIGLLGSFLTGAAEITLNFEAGVKMAVEDVTEGTWEILGRRIEFIFRDDEFSPEVGLRRARELVEEVGVELLMGGVMSSIALAVSGYARENHVIQIDPWSIALDLTQKQGHRYIFRTMWHADMMARGAGEVVRLKGWKKIVYIGPDYAAGWSMGESLRQVVPQVAPGAEVLDLIYSPMGEPDLRPYITRILAAKPDAVVSLLWADDFIAFSKQATPLGFFDTIEFVGITGMWPAAYKSLGMEMPDGIYAGDTYYFLATDSPENRRFIERYRVITGMDVPPDGIVYNSYIAMQFYLEAIKKAGTTETEAVIDALEGLTVVGPLGVPVTMTPYEHQAYLPLVLGRSITNPDYPNWKVFTDLEIIPGDKLVTPEEEVRQRRGG